MAEPVALPVLVAIRVRNGNGIPRHMTEQFQPIDRIECKLCEIEYVIATPRTRQSRSNDYQEQKVRSLVLLTHPRHPDIIDVNNPWG